MSRPVLDQSQIQIVITLLKDDEISISNIARRMSCSQTTIQAVNMKYHVRKTHPGYQQRSRRRLSVSN